MFIMQDVSVGVLGLGEVWRCGLRRIPKKVPRLFLPGEMLATDINNHPIVVLTATLNKGGVPREAMMITHTGDAAIVNNIIGEFRKNGVSPQNITMNIQTHDQGRDASFMTRAMLAGILRVWASSQIADFLQKMGPATGEERMITIRRERRTQ